MKKRGQVAIFIIIAIVIVGGVALVYFLLPQTRTAISGDSTATSYLQNCFEKDLQKNLIMLGEQGGYENPEGFVLYNSTKVKYLCYTSQYYLPCKVQQPLISRNFEIELARMMNSKADECVDNLKKEFESRGYTVNLKANPSTSVEMTPEKIKFIVKSPMTISKESAQNFDEFEIEVPSKMYNLIMISTSIVSYESSYGNTDTDVFRRYYPNIDINKIELDEGTTVFVVKDIGSKERFVFASRSLAWPGGYGLNA